MNKHFKNSTIGVVKSIISKLPVIEQVLDAYDAYKKSIFESNLENSLNMLNKKVSNIESLFSHEWLETTEGKQYLIKIFDLLLDCQIQEKQVYFVNALINGIENKDIVYIEKLKFVDMLKQISLGGLIILSKMHQKFIAQVRGKNRNPVQQTSFPLVNANELSKEFSDEFDPYFVNACVKEMESMGLFSKTGEYKKTTNGKYESVGGFATELCYTDFSARFVEFITLKDTV